MKVKMNRSRGVFYSLIGYTITPLAGFLTVPVLAHALGVTGRGESTAATAPLILGMAVFTMGLPEAMTYFIARNPIASKKILFSGFRLILIPGILGTFIFLLLTPYLASYDTNLIKVMSICTIMLLPALLVGVLRGAAIGLEKFALIALERSFSSLLKLASVLILTLVGEISVFTASLAIAVTSFLGGLFYLPLLFSKKYTKSIVIKENNHDIQTRNILKYGLYQWFGSLAGILLSRLDQLLMTPLSSSYELGLYSVAVSLGDLVLVVNNALREVVFSVESKGARGERIAKAARISNLAALLIGIVVCISSIWIIPLLFGKEFSGAWILTVVLIIGSVLGNPGSLAGTGLSAAGHPELRSWSLVFGCIVNFVMMIVLVPSYGALGAAYATMGGSITAASGNLIFTRKILGTKINEFIIPKKTDLVIIYSLLAKLRGKNE